MTTPTEKEIEQIMRKIFEDNPTEFARQFGNRAYARGGYVNSRSFDKPFYREPEVDAPDEVDDGIRLTDEPEDLSGYGEPEKDSYTFRVNASNGRIMREINPRPEPPKKEPDCVRIAYFSEDDSYRVSMPRRGRLGSTVLLDAETGRPANIGPTRHGPARWLTGDEALHHFARVDEAFIRLFGG